MSVKLRRIILLILTLCLLLPGTAVHAAQDIWVPEQSTQPSQPETSATVLGTVTRGDLVNTNTISGNKYYPYVTTVFSPDFTVTYVKHLVKKNDRVKVGDPLVEVTVTTDPVELARAELNLQRAEDSYAQGLSQREDSLLVLQMQANTETDPYEKQILELNYQKQLLSLEQYRRQQEKSLASLRAQVEDLQTQAATTMVYAPVEGLVTDIQKSSSGATLSPGTALVTIADESVVLLSVSKNTFLTYGMETEVIFTGEENACSGRVVAAGNFLAEADNAAAYVLLDSPEEASATSSNCRITGTVASYQNVLLAPHNAVDYVLEDGRGFYFTYRLVDGKTQRRQLRVLYQTGDQNKVTADTCYWILWGLDEGDTLVSG